MASQAGFVVEIHQETEESFTNDGYEGISSWPAHSGDYLDSDNDPGAIYVSRLPSCSYVHNNVSNDTTMEARHASLKIHHYRKRKHTSPSDSEQMKAICQADLRQNHLWTSDLEIETLTDYHFGIVLPRLRSLVPQNAPEGLVKLPDVSVANNRYSRAYLRLLVVAMTNNLAGLESFPVHSILNYIETRFTTKHIATYLTSLTKAVSRAFAEGLLRCAVFAGNPAITDFILSRTDYCIDINEVVILSNGARKPLWRHSLDSRDIPVAGILIKHGADVNKVVAANGDTPLTHAFRRTPVDLDFISFLLDAGAHGSHHVMLQALENLSLREHSCARMLHRLLSCSTPSRWSSWHRSKIFLIAISDLSKSYCLEFANLMLQHGADLNDALGSSGTIHKCGEQSPSCVIDVAAKRGHQDLVEMFLERGALPTEQTLAHAVWSGNPDLVEYLISGVKILNKLKISRSLPKVIRSTSSVEILELLERQDVLPTACRDQKRLLELFDALQTISADDARSALAKLTGDQADPQETASVRDYRLAQALGCHLVQAIKARRGDIVGLLIDHGASFSPGVYRDSNGAKIHTESPLIIALQTKNIGVVQALLDAGADPEAEDHFPSLYPKPSLWALAIEWGELSVLGNLIRAGARVDHLFPLERNGKSRSCSPLALAAEKRDLKLAQFLLEAGADANLASYEGPLPTPLMASVKNGDHAMAELLFAHGCDPMDTSALMTAYEKNDEKFVKILLRHFIRRYPYGKPQYGTIVLQNAIRKGDFNSVSFLVKGNVDIRYNWLYDIKSDFTEAPLATAIKTDRSGRQEILRLLVQSGVDPNDIVAYATNWVSLDGSESPPRHTPLLEAIRTNNHAAVITLVELGADINFEPRLGIRRTPLQYASQMGSISLVELLLESGGLVNALPAPRGGATALQLAAIGGYIGIAELLLEHGAEVNAPTANVHGSSAIDGAAEYGRYHMVEFLLRRGAEIVPNVGNGECRAVRLAKENGHMAVVHLLQEHLASVRSPQRLYQSVNIRESQTLAARPICEMCLMSFKNRSSLARHWRTQHSLWTSGVDREHQCTVCLMTFKRKDILTRHLSTHTKAMHVSCPTCKKEFRKDYFKHEHLDEQGRCKKAPASIDMDIEGAILE